MEMNGKNMQVLCKYRLITEAAFIGKGMIVLQILENFQETNRGGALFQYS